MGDGSDGAGGVGNGGSNAASNSASDADGIGNAAESVADAIGQAVDSLAEAIGNALGAVGDVTGLSSALGQLGDMLGIDADDLQGIVGAALMGAVTGGLPGAVAAVAQSLVGGSLTDAAKDAVSANLPSQFQGIASLAIDTFARGIPGALDASHLQGALGTLASGALTSGRAPSATDIGEVARAITGLTDVAREAFNGVAGGHFDSAADAATAFDGSLRSAFEQGRQVAQDVATRLGEGRGVYAEGGRDAFGDAAERLAVSTARLIAGH
ncbi:MAG TPA: hypothetical protein VM619_12025 [Luteimonas sp.]|nr:hypothetical protein [Luteimonas sp.]